MRAAVHDRAAAFREYGKAAGSIQWAAVHAGKQYLSGHEDAIQSGQEAGRNGTDIWASDRKKRTGRGRFHCLMRDVTKRW